MVDLIESDNHTTVLIATKALAVVCRNSPANQALAIRRGLLAKCIALLSRCDDTYTAKWVILVINALVYENGEVRMLLSRCGEARAESLPASRQWACLTPDL